MAIDPQRPGDRFEDQRPRRVNRDGPALFNGEARRFKVTRIIGSKGFAFGANEDGKEVFLHRTGSFDDPNDFDALTEGAWVTCKVADTAKGWRAFDAQLAAAE